MPVNATGRQPDGTGSPGTELDRIAEIVVRCAYKVANALGTGFLEKVYENSLAFELRDAGLQVEQQAPIKIKYRGIVAGEYTADLLIEGGVLVELKAVKELDDVHFAQCMNYLKGTGLHLCLLINFGNPILKIRRVVREFPE
jgi:GxxExxY protein